MSTFHFKQFSIRQENAAMKIGTDGVLLGGWVANQFESAQRILDIGTGTGVLALMLAQHFNEAQIHGVEQSPAACIDASHNFSSSTFSKQLTLHQTRIQDYESETHFDLIVSNPPYFQDSLHAATKDRTHARHQTGLSLVELFGCAANLSTENGLFALILPHDLETECLDLATKAGWNSKHVCHVRGTIDRPVKRSLILLSKQPCETEYSELTIERSRHEYTEDYIKLTREYYLKM